MWEGFETIVLPRRVVRRLRLTRLFYRYTWVPFWRLAHRISSGRRLESILSFYGPLSLLVLIALWVAAMISGFALVQWSVGAVAGAVGDTSSFAVNLYLSGTTFFTLGLGDVRPLGSVARIVTVVESGMGFGFLALVISYFPALYGSFSRRELGISMLDARAGSPSTALVIYKRARVEWGEEVMREQLIDWERWCAELMESHLSYPVLAYYRSQHDNQSWLAALTTILDTCVLVLARMEGPCARQAELTFATARHAVVDISAVFNQPPRIPEVDRLPDGGFEDFLRLLYSIDNGPALEDSAGRIRNLKKVYEPYVRSLADFFCLDLPPWVPGSDEAADWQTSPWGRSFPFDSGPSVPEGWENHFR